MCIRDRLIGFINFFLFRLDLRLFILFRSESRFLLFDFRKLFFS